MRSSRGKSIRSSSNSVTMSRTAELNRSLRMAVEQFLTSGTDDVLLRLIGDHPELSRRCAHKYPFAHRIQDLVVRGRTYRVLRCVTCAERLTLEPTDHTCADLGVPLWLVGEHLAYWARRVVKYGEDGPTDWFAFKRLAESAPISELEERDARQAAEAEAEIRKLMDPEGQAGNSFLPIDPR